MTKVYFRKGLIFFFFHMYQCMERADFVGDVHKMKGLVLSVLNLNRTRLVVGTETSSDFGFDY